MMGATPNDTQIMLLRNETIGFRVGDVVKELTASGTSMILAAIRPDKKGQLWLGSWRRIANMPPRELVELCAQPVYSDSLCRSLASELDPVIVRAHCILCPAPVVRWRERVVTGKHMAMYVVPRSWLKARSQGTR